MQTHPLPSPITPEAGKHRLYLIQPLGALVGPTTCIAVHPFVACWLRGYAYHRCAVRDITRRAIQPHQVAPHCDCCPRANEYNGLASGPTGFLCPERCPCHD